MSKRGQILLLHNHSKDCALNTHQLDGCKTFFNKTLHKAELPTNINPCSKPSKKDPGAPCQKFMVVPNTFFTSGYAILTSVLLF